MKNTSPGFLAGMLVLVSFTGVVHAQSVADIIKSDQARWAGIPTESSGFHPAPASWEHANDSNTHVAASFPCHPRRVDRTVQGRQLVGFMCKDGQANFVLQIGVGVIHDNSKAGLEQAFAGVDDSLSAGLRKRFGSVSAVPEKYLAYSGFNGRQIHFEAGGYELISRVVVINGNLCEMLVSGAKDKIKGQAAVFFDSLESGGGHT